MSKLVCFCGKIKEADISKAITEKGAKDIQMIRETTGAASCCGKCITVIELILENHQLITTKL